MIHMPFSLSANGCFANQWNRMERAAAGGLKSLEFVADFRANVKCALASAQTACRTHGGARQRMNIGRDGRASVLDRRGPWTYNAFSFSQEAPETTTDQSKTGVLLPR
jgi:hypothetical protein